MLLTCASPRARSSESDMEVSLLWRAAQRHITFSSITDDAEAISKLRQIAEEISTWSGEDWAMFNAPAVKLRLDTQGSDRYGGAGPSVVH